MLKCRLVVGKVNLVENIADLAQGKWRYGELDDAKRDEVRSQFAGKVKLPKKKRRLVLPQTLRPMKALLLTNPKTSLKKVCQNIFSSRSRAKKKFPMAGRNG